MNLVGVPVADRPGFFAELLPRLQQLRLRTGRPHWIGVDEAHHMLPATWAPGSAEITGALNNLIQITVHPDSVSPAALKSANVIVGIGPSAHQVIEGLGQPIGPVNLEPGEALVWFRDSGKMHRIRYVESTAERKRHKRKYARGDLGDERSFYFRGRESKLNLRARNLLAFMELANGVDDDTWVHHLRKGDYSKWFRDDIKDPNLADEAALVERDRSLDARASREKIREAIEHRYTAPV